MLCMCESMVIVMVMMVLRVLLCRIQAPILTLLECSYAAICWYS